MSLLKKILFMCTTGALFFSMANATQAQPTSTSNWSCIGLVTNVADCRVGKFLPGNINLNQVKCSTNVHVVKYLPGSRI